MFENFKWCFKSFQVVLRVSSWPSPHSPSLCLCLPQKGLPPAHKYQSTPNSPLDHLHCTILAQCWAFTQNPTPFQIFSRLIPVKWRSQINNRILSISNINTLITTTTTTTTTRLHHKHSFWRWSTTLQKMSLHPRLLWLQWRNNKKFYCWTFTVKC